MNCFYVSTTLQVFSWKTSPFDPPVSPSSDSISEGPVLSIRYSLDHKLLAVLRSDHELQIWNREGAEICSYKCRPELNHILGFFWTDCPTCDIVVVKTRCVLLLFLAFLFCLSKFKLKETHRRLN